MPLAFSAKRHLKSAGSAVNPTWVGPGSNRLLGLPEALAWDILLAIPVHDLLLSCILTCRHFRNLISSPQFLIRALKRQWKHCPDCGNLDSSQIQQLFWHKMRNVAIKKMEHMIKNQNDNFFRVPGGLADNRLKNVIARLNIRIKAEIRLKPVNVRMKMCLRQLQINDWSVLAKFKCQPGAFSKSSLNIEVVSGSTFQRSMIAQTNDSTEWQPVKAESKPEGFLVSQAVLNGNVSITVFECDNEFQFLILSIPSFSIFKLLVPCRFTISSKPCTRHRGREISSLSICMRSSNAILWHRSFTGVHLDGNSGQPGQYSLISSMKSCVEVDTYLDCVHSDWLFQYGQFKGCLKNVFMIDMTLWSSYGNILGSYCQLVNPIAIAELAESKIRFDADCYSDVYRYNANMGLGLTLEFDIARTDSGRYLIDTMILEQSKLRQHL